MGGVGLVSAIGFGFVWRTTGAALRPLQAVVGALRARPPRDLSELQGQTQRPRQGLRQPRGF